MPITRNLRRDRAFGLFARRPFMILPFFWPRAARGLGHLAAADMLAAERMEDGGTLKVFGVFSIFEIDAAVPASSRTGTTRNPQFLRGMRWVFL